MIAFCKKILDILKSIEPLFRFIEVILVVFGTVFVSCQANTIAQQANTIAEAQLSISKEENQPNFIIDQVLEPNNQGTENANAVIYIYNTGATFYNLDVDIACVIDLNYIGENLGVVKHSFSLKDFYWITGTTTDTEGLLCRMFHEGNWERFNKLYRDVLYDDRLESGYIDFWQYVKISYEDIYGEKHTNYYMVNEVRQRLITQDEGERVFSQYKENSNIIYTDTLDLNKLLDKIA